MPDTIIPVTYAGDLAYSLVFRADIEGLSVRRDSDEGWKPVVDIRATPIERDPDHMAVEINGDLKQGAPIFAWMRTADWETVKRMKGS